MQPTLLLTPDRDTMTDESTDITKVQFGEPVSFVGVTYRNMGESLLIGGEITQRQLNHRRPPQHG